MYLQPLKSSSSTVTLGVPSSVVQLRLPPVQQAMDIGNLLNNKSPQPSSRSPSSAFGSHLAAPTGYHSHASSVSEVNFDARSTASSEYMAQYSPQTLSRPPALSPQTAAYPDPSQYQSQLAGSEPSSNSSQLPYDPIEDRSRAAAAAAAAAQHTSMSGQPRQNDAAVGSDAVELPKAFACSTCHKGFARRSDLVRHERIHSGVRPHVCQHPGCGKQFIQRSALTVHERVHTKEKPHQCEKCGKPFSDSSSLARHRRIHSGTRPYQCPYADCQKTFTRRTTLTRHQNHHTGTVEEAAAARAAALASKASAQTTALEHQQPKQDGATEPGEQSDASSSTPSYNPYMGLPPNMQRHGGFQSQQEYYGGSPAAKGGVYPPPPRAAMGQQGGQPDIKSESYPQPGLSNHPAWPYPGAPQTAPPSWDSVPRGAPNESYPYQAPPHGYQPSHR